MRKRRLTIALSGKTVAKLQVVVAAANAANGTDLTLAAWATLHLQELAIAQELAAAINSIRAQQEREANDTLAAAVNAARGQLLTDLKT